MLILPRPIVMVIGAFAPLFSKRVFEHAKLLVIGAILAPGKRTVTAVLRVMGKRDDRHFQSDHRVLSRAPWPALRGGRRLLRLLVRACVPTGPVVIGIDETIARRRGEQMAAKGLDRDPVRSSPAHFGTASGWRGVRLRLLAPIPWTTRVWARPFLTVLSPSERSYPPRSHAPRTLVERARQAVWLVRRWAPEREPVVVGDHTYAALEWRDAVRHAVCVIATRCGALRACAATHAQTKWTATPKRPKAADLGADVDRFDGALADGDACQPGSRRPTSCSEHFQPGCLVSRGQARSPRAMGLDARSRRPLRTPGVAGHQSTTSAGTGPEVFPSAVADGNHGCGSAGPPRSRDAAPMERQSDGSDHTGLVGTLVDGELDGAPPARHQHHARAHGGLGSQRARHLFRHDRSGAPLCVASVPCFRVGCRR
jgi:hypothetical protein